MEHEVLKLLVLFCMGAIAMALFSFRCRVILDQVPALCRFPCSNSAAPRLPFGLSARPAMDRGNDAAVLQVVCAAKSPPFKRPSFPASKCPAEQYR